MERIRTVLTSIEAVERALTVVVVSAVLRGNVGMRSLVSRKADMDYEEVGARKMAADIEAGSERSRGSRHAYRKVSARIGGEGPLVRQDLYLLYAK
jgi:hypothetical protein